MMKMLGAGLIVLSCALAGAYRAAELRERAALLAALTSALELMRGEICARLAPLPQTAERLAESGPEETREFFAALATGMERLGERDFSRIWRDSAEGLRGLRADEYAALRDLGGTLGRYGANEQESAICRCMETIGAAARDAKEEAASGGRLYAGLGITAGLLLAAVLV